MSVVMNQATGELKATGGGREFPAPKLGITPEMGIILGTGLGQFAAAMKPCASIAYRDIPNFPVPSVESHAGVCVGGARDGGPSAVMNGRVHYNEGYSMRDVTFPVRVLRALGVRTLLITNAAGGMNPLYAAGDIVVAVDHINLMGENPLRGANEESLGPRFPDMSEPYSRELITPALETAREEKIPLREGVFVAVAGPNLETRTEYRFLRWAGADLVGMSVVPETIVAVHGGMRVLALSVVTDLCLPDALEPIDVPRVLATAAQAEPL